jgi:hypothetical protein
MRFRKKFFKVIAITMILALTPAAAFSAQKVNPGSACKVYKQKTTYKNRIYTCVKSGKKLVWNKGVLRIQATPTPTPTPTPRVTPTPTPTPTPSPTNTTNGGIEPTVKTPDNVDWRNLPASASLKPTPVTNLSSKWNGTTLEISWKWNNLDPNNLSTQIFNLCLTSSRASNCNNLPITARSYNLDIARNKEIFGAAQNQIVFSLAPDRALTIVSGSSPKYSPSLLPPQIIVTAGNSSYGVKISLPADPTLSALIIEEAQSSLGPFTIMFNNPAIGDVNIAAPDSNKRWVRAYFVDVLGSKTDYSNVIEVQPLP